VLVVTTPDKQPLQDFRVFNLLDQTVDGNTVEIKHTLSVDQHPVDATGYLASL
jgi:hypothetical protein